MPTPCTTAFRKNLGNPIIKRIERWMSVTTNRSHSSSHFSLFCQFSLLIMALNNPNSLLLGGSSDDAVAKSARAEYDRRNRTLPHPKHGPYACPRCEGLLTTSQLFAAHMRTHYKSESEEERRMR